MEVEVGIKAGVKQGLRTAGEVKPTAGDKMGPKAEVEEGLMEEVEAAAAAAVEAEALAEAEAEAAEEGKKLRVVEGVSKAGVVAQAAAVLIEIASNGESAIIE